MALATVTVMKARQSKPRHVRAMEVAREAIRFEMERMEDDGSPDFGEACLALAVAWELLGNAIKEEK